MQPESPKMNPLMTDYPLKTDPKPVIVALDFAGEQDTLAFVRRLDPALCRLKVGKELFTATGRALVEKLVNQGFDVFLDLKYQLPVCRLSQNMLTVIQSSCQLSQ